MRAFFRWMITPPQAYAVYAVLVIAIGSLSFLAGTLKPHKAPGAAPPAVSAPR
jgi:hypothetical protein